LTQEARMAFSCQVRLLYTMQGGIERDSAIIYKSEL